MYMHMELTTLNSLMKGKYILIYVIHVRILDSSHYIKLVHCNARPGQNKLIFHEHCVRFNTTKNRHAHTGKLYPV